MKFEVYKMFSMKDVPKNIKIVYDKTSKKRPAWILVEGLPDDIVHLGVKINGRRLFTTYRVYIPLSRPLFLPSDYTKEEMRKFYDKFAEIYDKRIEPRNFPATKFLLKNLRLQKNVKILDLGAGTGISSIPFIQSGYSNITLLDFSENMLAKAKKRKELKNCKFVTKDILKFNLKNKFDLIISIFSFASNSYFDEDEMPKLWRKIAKHLDSNGILALFGYDHEPPKNFFRKIKSGKRELYKGYASKWYIGKKNRQLT